VPGACRPVSPLKNPPGGSGKKVCTPSPGLLVLTSYLQQEHSRRGWLLTHPSTWVSFPGAINAPGPLAGTLGHHLPLGYYATEGA
jgi:hypothetical protein